MIDLTREIDLYLKRLFPINRSIMGNGNRETLRIFQEIIPLTIKEYPSGLSVYDWTIPKEWNIRDGWIKNAHGETIISYASSNLHIMSYSVPVHKKMMYSEIKEHLHYLERLPDAIPYRTSYYREDWGFCDSYNAFIEKFHEDKEYEIFIDTTLTAGSLSIGEFIIPGKSEKEYLLSTYICHPSLANDNLSGMVMTAFLARELMKKKLYYTYRIVFVPETIGAIAYCAQNEEAMKKIDMGLLITTVGGPGKFGYKQSFNKDHVINRLIEEVFAEAGVDYITYPFDIHGSDERQYSSIGFRINIATICKDKYYEYDYYHTSIDNINYVTPEAINLSLNRYLQTIEKIDKNVIYENTSPNCEVMLSKHDLYPKTGGGLLPLGEATSELDVILWLLFYCDGKMSLFEISEKMNIDLGTLCRIARKLEKKKILNVV